MPLTAKGKKIKRTMKRHYGAKSKGAVRGVDRSGMRSYAHHRRMR